MSYSLFMSINASRWSCERVLLIQLLIIFSTEKDLAQVTCVTDSVSRCLYARPISLFIVTCDWRGAKRRLLGNIEAPNSYFRRGASVLDRWDRVASTPLLIPPWNIHPLIGHYGTLGHILSQMNMVWWLWYFGTYFVPKRETPIISLTPMEYPPFDRSLWYSRTYFVQNKHGMVISWYFGTYSVPKWWWWLW